jgi:integrase
LNPGSQAWKACVLNQLDDDRHSDTVVLETKKAIASTLTMLTNDGQKPNTVRHTKYKLQELAAQVDLFDPEAVKHYVATAISEKTKQPFSAETKNKFLYAADKFYENQGIQWKKPYHKVEEKIPLIPTTENVELIITNASQKYATIFTILAETGAEGKELEKTSLDQIDTEQGIINITGCKGHGSGSYKLKKKTAEMLRIYLHKHPEKYPFPKSNVMGQVWRDTRKRTATKLCKTELNKIPLKNLRNYSGAKLYYKTQDPIAVMRHLRHKKLETTMHYIRGITIGGEEEYTCKTAQTIGEATQLIENGFQYVTEIDGIKLFKKPK